MLRSMTAYAKVQKTINHVTFIVEMSSLNRKFLEVSLSLPSFLQSLEIPIRKQISDKIGRGCIKVILQVLFEKQTAIEPRPNIALTKGYFKALREVAHALEVPFCQEDAFRTVIGWQGVLEVSKKELEVDEVALPLKTVVEECLLHLISMKKNEGTSLTSDFIARIESLETSIKKIDLRRPFVIEQQEKKLQDLLLKTERSLGDDRERLIRELALFAKQVDITEELVRFRHHLISYQSFLTVLDPFEKGKKLEFFLQELQREINTIGAKAQDSEITSQVIEIKSEIEKMREQVQNVE